LAAFEDPAGPAGEKAGPGAYSTSSLGYAGLHDLLKRLGWTVKPGDAEDPGPADAEIVVFAEPNLPAPPSVAAKIARSPGRTLVVLPKWKGTGNPRRSRWIAEIEPIPPAKIENFFASIVPDGRIVRRTWPTQWETNRLGIAPTGSGMAQLMLSPGLEILVGGESGILLGELREGGKTAWILSDPDVMSNHGIGNGDNAAFMLALFNRVRGDAAGTVAFDETLHGYRRRAPSSPLRLMFEFPFVVATALGFLSAILLILAGARRFGRPEKAGNGPGFGKAGLIGNSARLMEYSGHRDHIPRSYVRMAMADAGGALHAPPGLAETALAAWLDDLGRRRRVNTEFGDVLRKMGAGAYGRTEALARARDVHRWRRDLLAAGPGPRPGSGKPKP
jgi:hypothetical protein